MSTVIIRQAEYTDQSIRDAVYEMLSSDEGPVIEPGSRVLIKPNFLKPATPDQAVTTHPLIVRTAVEYALEKGARVQVSDSQASGSFRAILQRGGFNDALAGLDVTVKPFEQSVGVNVGEPFGTIDVARDAIEADVVVNLAKLKTHTHMTMTLGVKNCFGCVVGLKKPEWHMRTGVDRHMFGRLIVSIYEAVKPAYTIVDGILGMEGQGPGRSGTPRELGLLLGGSNAHAVDHVICLLLGLEAERLETQLNARQLGFYDGTVSINGEINILNNFQLPDLGSVTMGPAMLGQLMRRFFIQRPVVNKKTCKLCGECWKYCPVQAINYTDRGITFDTDVCIRCYCCLEVCPHAAIRAKRPMAGKLFEWLQDKW